MGTGRGDTGRMAGLAVAVEPVVRRARGLSIVFVGMSLIYVIGIPLATWVGLGWGWRLPVWAAVALTAVALSRCVHTLAPFMLDPSDTHCEIQPPPLSIALLPPDRSLSTAARDMRTRFH